MNVFEANRLLNVSGITRNNTNEQDPYVLFAEFDSLHSNDEFNPVDDAADEEIFEFPYTVEFELKDLNFCVFEESGEVNLTVSYRNDTSYDQSMIISDLPDYCNEVMEQEYEIATGITADTVIKDLEALGATYDKELEEYF